MPYMENVVWNNKTRSYMNAYMGPRKNEPFWAQQTDDEW